MSARMKKRPIEVVVDGETFSVPASKAKRIFSLVKGHELSKDELIPWREVARAELSKTTASGVALRGARLRDGLSQVELSKKIGVSQYNISKMENGSRPVGKEMAKRLAKVFKVDYRVFL